MTPPRPLPDRIVAAFLWVAAFAIACGVFFSVTLLFRHLPPVDPVAVGLVTIERVSKLKDYLGAALFMTLVPILTVWLQGLGAREAGRLRRRMQRHPRVAVILFTTPCFLAPLFYLTTGKIGWILLLPLVLAFALPRALEFVETRRWLRDLFGRELGSYHALLFCAALSWILFRYVVTGRRIAHYPTLFLELIFVALFLGFFWAVAIYTSRVTALAFGLDAGTTFARIATGSLALVALPFFSLAVVPTLGAAPAVAATLIVAAWIAARRSNPLAAATAWRLAAFVILPALIYAVSYGSTAQLSQWIDLFHRGETIGPASDYLRGKVPYRDVFVLHGMLEDGLLDAWLMQIFGRSIDVAIFRTVVIGAFLPVAIWFLGLAIFRSIPLALLVVAMGAFTTTENNRTVFQVAAVALFWAGASGARRLPLALGGVFAGVALFFSYEIGLYTIAGAVISAVLLRVLSGAPGASPAHEGTSAGGAAGAPLSFLLGWFVAGLALGAAPFLIYLALRGALDDFFVTSFVTIPRIIDAVWSLPFPDLVSTFRKNLNIHTLADFVVWEKFHLILSPLTIAIAGAYAIARWVRRRVDTLDRALVVLAVFAAIAQRTAFGRAEFRHQYFAAFLIGPLLVVLAVIFARRIRGLWKEGGDEGRPFVAGFVVVLAIVAAALFWIPDLINWRINDLLGYQARVERRVREPHAEEVAWRIREVTREIRALTRPGEPLFDFSNQPAFYFFADRPNPTRFYQVPILSPVRFQAETIAALEKARPNVVLRTAPEGFDAFDGVPNSLRAQAVSAYLDDCYRFFKSERGVEIWTRDPSARPRPLAALLKQIRVPTKEQLVSSGVGRVVFPIVGSAWGIGGAHWVSDVTLHNPFRDPIEVKLRYVSGKARADRTLTLAARQTIRWPDIVKTFFAAPESIGSLWIQHRVGRAPVVVVKTWDDARGARASVETPLSHRDAATAGGDAAELTIIGLPPASSARRVNVGVVNLGNIPGTFRVTVRARNGRQIGKPVESGVPEGELWLVTDIERATGAAIDETTTVRITPIAGTGVAFATVVEQGGESEFIAAIPAQQP